MSARLVPFILLLAIALFAGPANTVFAQAQPTVPLPPTSPPNNPLDVLIWDAVLKEEAPAPGQMTADFVFKMTNSADHEVVIDHVSTSCGCTVAKLPGQEPGQAWRMPAHTNSEISVSVNLGGKSGTFVKTITVFSTNQLFYKALTVRVTMPDAPEVNRQKNMQISRGDPQAIFKGDCARCHVDPARGKLGKALYVSSCGICHEATQRASMVPDLHSLRHPTDYAYWKQIISAGKPNTMMPGFSVEHGGPLSPEQVDSLAKILDLAFPSIGTNPRTGFTMPRPPPINVAAPAAVHN